MTEDEKIEWLSEKISKKWQEHEAGLDKFLSTVNPETPALLLITLLIAKAADIAIESNWKEESFLNLAGLAFEDGQGLNSKHLH